MILHMNWILSHKLSQIKRENLLRLLKRKPELNKKLLELLSLQQLRKLNACCGKKSKDKKKNS